MAVTEYLAIALQEGRLKLGKADIGSVSFQDPCQLDRKGGVGEAPRALMKAMGVDLHEMENNRGFSFCCGGGGGVVDIERAAPLRYRTMEVKMREIDVTNSETFLTGCSDCRHTFDDAQRHFGWNKTPQSLLELVAKSLCPRAGPALSAQTIVVDPVTRIEGHLRIEAQFDGSKITQAMSSGTMVRGIEIILRDRDPRDAWAFAQTNLRRLHAGARHRVGARRRRRPRLPDPGKRAADPQSHDGHAVRARPRRAFLSLAGARLGRCRRGPQGRSQGHVRLAQSTSSYARSSPGYFADVQQRIKTLVESGQLGIFANGYWGHPGYRLPPEANLMAMAHYLDALAWQRRSCSCRPSSAARIRIRTCSSAASPRPSASIRAPARRRPRSTKWACRRSANHRTDAPVHHRGLCSRPARDRWFLQGLVRQRLWRGHRQFHDLRRLSERATLDPKTFLVPRGAILNRDLSTIHEVDLTASGDIQEFVAHSWYDYAAGKTTGLHPYAGETQLKYSGPTPPYANLDAAASYSWIKSPRWKGHAMEMGPLARVLMMYASGHAPTVALTNDSLGRLGLPFEALYSVMGRNLARALECQILTDALPGWQAQLQANIAAGDVRTFNEKQWERSTWPSHAQGVGCLEAPRGSLAHWIVIDDGLISNYQAVVPTTWNAGPRDAAGVAGPYEAALEGIRPCGPETAARDSAHRAQLRSLSRLRGASHRFSPGEITAGCT
jgi:hydrogenase large subunit